MTTKAKRRLTKIETFEISGVDVAANDQKFLEYKRAEENSQKQKPTTEIEKSTNNIQEGSDTMKTKNKKTKNLIEPIEGFDEMTSDEKKAAIRRKISEQEAKLNMANQEMELEGTQIKSMDELNDLFEKVDKKFSDNPDAGKKVEDKNTETTVDLKTKEVEISEEFKNLEADDREKVLKMAIDQEKRIAKYEIDLIEARKETKRLQGLMPVREGLTRNHEEFDQDKKTDLMQKMIQQGMDPTKMEELLQNPRLLEDFSRTGLALSMGH